MHHSINRCEFTVGVFRNLNLVFFVYSRYDCSLRSNWVSTWKMSASPKWIQKHFTWQCHDDILKFCQRFFPISSRFQCITSRVDLTEWCQIGVLFKFQGAPEFPPNLFLKYLFVYAFMRTIEWILFGRYKSWNRWIKCTNWHYYYTLARWKWKENIWRDDICLVSVLPTFAYKRLTYWIQPNRSSPIEFGCC